VEHFDLIICPYDGVVVEVCIEETCCFKEWEKLFMIQTKAGVMEVISVGLCAAVQSIEVNEGDEVFPGMVLAFAEEIELTEGSK
jgi:hypothetical protein